MIDLAEYFFARIDRQIESPCWIWTGPTYKRGYGRMNLRLNPQKSAHMKAHRWAWAYFNGEEIPDGLVICHSCDNKRCVNPNHLRAASQEFNNWEARDRGRWKPNIGVKNGRAVLTPEIVEEIRKVEGSQQSIANSYGISQTHVSRIKRGESWA